MYFRHQHNIQLWSVPFSLDFFIFLLRYNILWISKLYIFFNFRVFTILVCLSNNRISDFFSLGGFLSLGAQMGPYPWKNHTCKLTNYFSHSIRVCTPYECDQVVTSCSVKIKKSLSQFLNHGWMNWALFSLFTKAIHFYSPEEAHSTHQTKTPTPHFYSSNSFWNYSSRNGAKMSFQIRFSFLTKNNKKFPIIGIHEISRNL